METWPLCFLNLMTLSRLRNIWQNHLQSRLKLETEKEKQQPMEIMVLCPAHSENMGRLESIMRKHLRSELN